MISIIVPVNNEEIYENLFLPSIQKQSFKDYEIIKLNAKELKLNSAAQTLNYGVSIAKGDIFVFCHQDIELMSDDALEMINKYSLENDFVVAGVAGVNIGNQQVYSSVYQDKDHHIAGIKIDSVQKIDVVDECLFIIKKQEFSNFVDYGVWHFYAVEQCLRSYEQNRSNLLFPIDIYHLSPGWSLDKSYWKALKKLSKDHKKVPFITTTMCNFKNNSFIGTRIMSRRLKLKIKSIIKKK